MTLNMKDLVEEVITYDGANQSTLDVVTYKLEMLGFELSEKPGGKPPRLPRSGISNLGDNDITDLQAVFVRWMEYAGEQAEIQNLLAKELESNIDTTIRKLKLKLDGTVAEREDKAKTNPTVIKLKKKLREAKALYSLLIGKHGIFDASRGVCSRDVERRRKDFMANSRENAIRSVKSRKRVTKKGPMRQRDLEVGSGR